MKIVGRAFWMLLAFVAPAFGQQIPSNAIVTAPLNTLSGWTWTHDKGTPGTSVGSSTYPISSPSLTGNARKFSVSYWDHGGERYHFSFGHDANATHFVYDTYVYIEDPSQVGNLEMDLNQVLDNGMTVFYATQCSGYTNSWEYTYVSNGSTHWHTSNIACNPRNWAAQKWHHVQIAVHRNSSGVVTHDWISFDGVTQYFNNATGYAGKYIGWAQGDLVLNVQPDGASTGNGQINLYLDKLHVDRW